MIGHNEYSAGDVRQGFEEYHRIYHLGNWQKNKECRECEYLPLCFGGCCYMEFQRTGSMKNVDCLRKYYDRTLGETVVQDACFQSGEAEAAG